MLEMHCHTVFSIDGYHSPEVVVDVAAERGVTVLSITEHNHLGSVARASTRARQRGIRYFSGVEIDATCMDRDLHLMGIGFDPADQPLGSLVAGNFAAYASHFELYRPKL